MIRPLRASDQVLMNTRTIWRELQRLEISVARDKAVLATATRRRETLADVLAHVLRDTTLISVCSQVPARAERFAGPSSRKPDAHKINTSRQVGSHRPDDGPCR